MSMSLTLPLRNPISPTGIGTRAVSRDPLYCDVCLNFAYSSVDCVEFRGDVFTNRPAGLVFTLAGASSWHRSRVAQFDASLKSIIEAACGGCVSCYLLQNGIQAICTRRGLESKTASAIEHIQVTITLGNENVLRVLVYHGAQSNPYNDPLGDLLIDTEDVSPVAETSLYFHSFNLELYSLPGQAFPWSAIGWRMSIQNPARSTDDIFKGGPTRHVSHDRVSNACLSLLRQWMQQCTESHLFCRPKAPAMVEDFPRRLVSLGCSSNSAVYLLETTGSNIKDEVYAALTYSSGNVQSVSLTRGRIEQWKQRIPCDVLPRTFRESIGIARALGYKYLWIDALCILQDDEDDWKTESAAISAIYRHADIVISATGGTDSEAGLFLEQPHPFHFHGVDPVSQQCSDMYLRESLQHIPFSLVTSAGTRWSSPAGLPLAPGSFATPTFKCAWCFQQRLLATRIIHFTTSEIFFECLDSMNCECGTLTNYKGDGLLFARQLLAGYDLEKVENWPIHDCLHRLSESDLAFEKRLQRGWRRLVEEYSQAHISVAADIFPALMVIASKWHKVLDARFPDQRIAYLAGVWSCDIYHSLMWIPLGPERLQEEAGYIAPSWSWASARREVEFLSYGDELMVMPATRWSHSVQHVSIEADRSLCVPRGSDKFGKVSTGWIHITGPLISARLISVQQTGNEQYEARIEWSTIAESKTFHFRPDCSSRCMELIGSEVLCLAVFTEVDMRATRFLALAAPREDSLKRLPVELFGLSSAERILERIGLITQIEAFREWEDEAEFTTQELFII